jgi:hypothetical protein
MRSVNRQYGFSVEINVERNTHFVSFMSCQQNAGHNHKIWTYFLSKMYQNSNILQ